MHYNLAGMGVLNSTTVSGNKTLSRRELQYITDSTVASGVDLYGDDILCLDLDLGQRILIDQLRYKFDSTTASGIVVNTIKVYYKNHIQDSWVNLPITVCNGYYGLTSISGISPRLIRLVHTVSGTTISGTLYEYYISNNDDIVDFGLSGNQTSKILSPTPEGESEVFSLDIYNDSDSYVNAHVVIGNSYSEDDEMLYISSSESSGFVSCTGNSVDLSRCSLNGTVLSSGKIYLSRKHYNPGLHWLKDTAVADPYRMVCRWNVGATHPLATEMYYAKGTTFRKWVVRENKDIVCASPPVSINLSSHLAYDYENDYIYLAYRKNSSTSGLYRYDPKTDSWSSELLTYSSGAANDSQCDNVVSLTFVPSGCFADGEASLCSATIDGALNRSTFYRIRLSDMSLIALSWSGYHFDGSNAADIVNMCNAMCFQPAGQYGGSKGKIWSIYGRRVDNFNIYDIENNNWSYIDISTLSKDTPFNSDYIDPRNTTISYFGNCFYFIDDYVSSDDYALHFLRLSDLRMKVASQYVDFYQDARGSSIQVYPYGDKLNVFLLRSRYEDLFYYNEIEETLYEDNGSIETPILETVRNSYLRIKAEIPSNSYISNYENVIDNTIEVRQSDTGRYDYYVAVARPSYTSGDHSAIYVYDDSNNNVWNGVEYEDYRDIRISIAFNGLYWFVSRGHDGGYNNQDENTAKLFIYDEAYDEKKSKQLKGKDSSSDSYWWVPKHIICDSSNGFWVIFGRGNYDTGQNYIKHYNFNLDEIGSKEIVDWAGYDGCTDGGLGLWYTDTSENKLYRLDTNGNPVVSIDMLSPRGCCEDGNGGVWVFCDYNKLLYHYSFTGSLIKTVSSELYSVSYLVTDCNGGCWLIDREDNKIKHISQNGSLVHSVQAQDPDYICSDFYGGIWYVTDSYDRVIHISDKGVEDYNFYHSNIKSWTVAARTDGPGKKVPDSNDPVWSNLDWETIPLDNHILPNKKYSQFRITLKTNDSSVSPIVEAIDMPDVVDINNIPPRSSKKLYLKTDIPQGELFEVKNVNLKVWFDLE